MDDQALVVKLVREAVGFYPTPTQMPDGRLVVGYGRDISTRGISESEASLLLLNDLRRITRMLHTTDPAYLRASPEELAKAVVEKLEAGYGSE